MGGFDVIDPRYATLYERVREVLGADPRVRSVELSGSVAAGIADQWSDLDLSIITDQAQHESFLADRSRWLDFIAPTVFARTPIAPFIVNTLTADGLTLDYAVWPGEVPARTPDPRYAVGMLSNERFADVADAVEYAVEEQLRGLAGPFISLLKREEHLRHLTGVPHVLGLLTTVFLGETDALPPGKRWNTSFTQEQLNAVAALPPVAATHDDLVAFSMGLAQLLVQRARPIYQRHGREWPSGLAAVSAKRLHSELGLEVSAWLY